MAKIYLGLFDPDSVEGAISLKETEPSLKEQIIVVINRLNE